MQFLRSEESYAGHLHMALIWPSLRVLYSGRFVPVLVMIKPCCIFVASVFCTNFTQSICAGSSPSPCFCTAHIYDQAVLAWFLPACLKQLLVVFVCAAFLESPLPAAFSDPRSDVGCFLHVAVLDDMMKPTVPDNFYTNQLLPTPRNH